MKSLISKCCFTLSFILSIFLNTGCKNLTDKKLEGEEKSFVSIRGQRFIDAADRVLILHGINLVNKNQEENYLGAEDQNAIKKIKSWGFNCIRLGIIWDGLEPEPGQYDANYMKGLDERIRWAAENDILVVLDMHQDLYSVLYSDGAPEWATLHEDKPHVTGEIWSESYFISPAVQTSFDNFWANAPAPDGIGIQDHYINAWKYVADRYANNKTVVGYDLMNEPFMGSDVVHVMPTLLKAYAELLVSEGRVPPPTEEELARMWSSEEERSKVYEKLSDPEKFAYVFDAIHPLHSAFEKEKLMPFYRKCREAIRKADSNHIIFIEHGIFANSGVLSDIQPLLTAAGEKDPQVAYAPHGYDLVTDTKAQAASSFERVNHIFGRIDQTGQRLGMPVLVGEWGAFYASEDPAVVAQTEFILKQFENRLFSHTYWSYFEDLDQKPYFKALNKSYPMAVSGNLLSYDFDYKTETLEVRWEETEQNTDPTVIFLHNAQTSVENSIELNPESEFEMIKVEGNASASLYIDPLGKNVKRMIKITFPGK